MGKGKKSAPPQPTNQTVTQTNLPEYAQPYFTNLMQRAQAESYRGYQPYEGDRIAQFNPLQTQAQNAAGALARPDQLGDATNLAGVAGLGALGTNYQGNQFTTDSFTTPGTADQFMSPYIQNVIDRQKFEATRDAEKADLAQDLGAARQGTYGGSRQLLASLERERNLERQLGDIQASGLQSAYDRGQSAFEQEQARRLQTQQMGEQSGQFGASLGLQGLQQAMEGAQTLGNLGMAQQESDLQRIQAQAAAGAEQQALEQQMLDTAYGDFLRQRDYPRESMQFYSSMLQGVPVALGSTQTAYAQPPSMLGQAGGLGLAGLGLYKMMNQ